MSDVNILTSTIFLPPVQSIGVPNVICTSKSNVEGNANNSNNSTSSRANGSIYYIPAIIMMSRAVITPV